MTRLLLLVIAAVGCGYALQAQKRFDLGIKGGVSIPELTSASSDNPISNGYGSRLDADAAVHAEIRITNVFSIEPQLEYSSQGGLKNGTQSFVVPDELLPLFPSGEAPPYLYADYKSEARINYLMLPVFAKYHFEWRNKWGAYIAAGPFVSYLLNAKNITRGSSIIYADENKTQPVTAEPQSFNNNENITSELHRFNSGISGHVGIRYSLATGTIFIEGGGNFGFVIMQKSAINGRNRTGAAVVSLGYQVTL